MDIDYTTILARNTEQMNYVVANFGDEMTFRELLSVTIAHMRIQSNLRKRRRLQKKAIRIRAAADATIDIVKFRYQLKGL